MARLNRIEEPVDGGDGLRLGGLGRDDGEYINSIWGPKPKCVRHAFTIGSFLQPPLAERREAPKAGTRAVGSEVCFKFSCNVFANPGWREHRDEFRTERI